MSKGIYIEEVEFPTRCFDDHGTCFAFDGVEHRCKLRKDKMVHFSTRVCGIKPSWCPLVEVPEHTVLVPVSLTER